MTVFISEEEAAYYRENGMPDIQAGDVTLTGSQALAHARNRTLGMILKEQDVREV